MRHQRLVSKQLIIDTKKQLREYLESFNKGEHKSSEIQVMKWFIIKEKLVCRELNKLEDGGDKILRGLFWCPRRYQDMLMAKVEEIKLRKDMEGGLQVTVIEEFDEEEYQRPTLIETSEFMWPFQEIVNTYGVP